MIEGGHADNWVLEYAVAANTGYLVRSVDKGVTICRADEIGFRQRKEEAINRKWKAERDYWLDHYGQYHPGNKRTDNRLPLRSTDYIAIPTPWNLVVYVNGLCLAWRWTLNGSGYGVLDRKPAHVVAYEQTRGHPVESGSQVTHLCHRPFCVQPGHLREGTPQDNVDDREAKKSGFYKTMPQYETRWKTALNDEWCWDSPKSEAHSPHWGDALECPHVKKPEMFIKKGQSGDARLCVNCDESRPDLPDILWGHREMCSDSLPPCRCEPCVCRRCLRKLLMPLQYVFHGAGSHSILIPRVIELTREIKAVGSRRDARRLREELEALADPQSD